jgi:hypothetical protein
VVRSPSIELFWNLRSQGIEPFLDESGKLKLRGPKSALSPELIEEAKAHKEVLRLFLEKGSKVLFCYNCGKETEFLPTPEVMDVFRRWECSECGRHLWVRESGSPSDGTLKAIIRAFRGAVVRYTPKEGS